MTTKKFAQVGIDTPLRRLFDYRIPASLLGSINPGCRVIIPFGKRTRMGIVVSTSVNSEFDNSRIKEISQLLDSTPIFDKESFSLISWAARYYQYSIGAALFTALPPALRKTSTKSQSEKFIWQVANDAPATILRAPKQTALLNWMRNYPNGVEPIQIHNEFPNCHSVIKALHERKYIFKIDAHDNDANELINPANIQLNEQQLIAENNISSSISSFAVHLLEGVTGSGKTEVYFKVIERVLTSPKHQVLILVPEIGLTPQLHQRLQLHFGITIGLLHSSVSESQRKSTWLQIAAGKIKIILGTRLAVFAPIPHLKLIVVDEEHDSSFKQQEGFLYHARDVAIYRAKQCGIPIILGSATPSFESLHNSSTNKFQHTQLTKRVHSDVMPKLHMTDMRTQQPGAILSTSLCDAMHKHLQAGNQVILFLNRRGYAPVLLCHDCGWVAQCDRCDANLTYHSFSNKLSCHHCDSTKIKPENCPTCQSSNLIMVGHGTQRIEEALKEQYSSYKVTRLDRDITKKKGQLEKVLEDIHQQRDQIIIGTQILSKGHDFPNVSLVGILDIDYGIYSSDFRALERCAQLLVQVSGRSGRRNTQGEVYVQTHSPDHPLLNVLLNNGYSQFAHQAIQVRKEWQLPPFAYHVAIRARAQKSSDLLSFLEKVSSLAKKYFHANIGIHGPISPPIEKKAGQIRAFILLTSAHRLSASIELERCIKDIESLSLARKVRWSVDVDPMDNY